MYTRTNIVIDNELIAQAMARARVTTKKAAVEAALKAYVHRPDYAALLALQVMDPIDPDYDPKGPYGLTPAALERRGWKTFEAARIAFEQQADKHIIKPVKKPLNPLNPLKAAPGKPSKKRVLTPA